MAKILPGLAVSKMSGTILGTTYQNHKGVLIARGKPTPTNVNSSRQSVIRSLMTLLSRAWRDELTKGLRTAWNQRAKNYPWMNVFGDTVTMSGENLYIKQNLVLLDHGLTRQDVPVPDTVPPELLDVVVEPDEGSGFAVTIPGLPAAIVTAQTPFVDVFFAGGFLEIIQQNPDEDIFTTLALSPGRTHHKSDFRHIVYHDDGEVILQPTSTISARPPEGQPKNCVMIIRRYNKFGNFTAPLLFSDIRTRA